LAEKAKLLQTTELRSADRIGPPLSLILSQKSTTETAMLDLIGGPMQSAMSSTFTWLSLLATLLEVVYRVRSYLQRRAANAVVKVKPPRRNRALARRQARKPGNAPVARMDLLQRLRGG
jgi:hypothetical protein